MKNICACCLDSNINFANLILTPWETNSLIQRIIKVASLVFVLFAVGGAFGPGHVLRVLDRLGIARLGITSIWGKGLYLRLSGVGRIGVGAFIHKIASKFLQPSIEMMKQQRRNTSLTGNQVRTMYNRGVKDFRYYNLRGIKLGRAHLEGADLRGAILEGAKLMSADLEGASLEGAELYYADLEGAKLKGAKLKGAKLIFATLTGADLTGADLEVADLEVADLMSANLTGANLERAKLGGANLEGAHLEGAHLEGAHLEGAKLMSANLTVADLTGAHLEGAKLMSANLTGADLTGAHLEGAELKGAKLIFATLTGADLTGADLEVADLEVAKLGGAHLEGANLERAKLVGANLEGAHLEGAELELAKLMSANLTGANLERAKLGGAHLEGANLEGANLEGADLLRANLEGANLEGANLKGADLYYADLEGANLKGAKLGGADLYYADLEGANLEGAKLGGADLRGADLTVAHLEGADLRRANLEGANLSGSNLKGADLRGSNLKGADLRDIELPVVTGFFKKMFSYPTISSLQESVTIVEWLTFVQAIRDDSGLKAEWNQENVSVDMWLNYIDDNEWVANLLVLGNQDEENPWIRFKYAMNQIALYFKSLDEEPRKVAMIKFGMIFGMQQPVCTVGKSNNLWNYYQSLLNDRRAKEPPNIAGANTIELLKRIHLDRAVHDFIGKSLTWKSPMMEDLITDGGFAQLAHDRLYVLNMLQEELNLDHVNQVDEYIGIVNPTLSAKSKTEILIIILTHTLAFTREHLRKEINSHVGMGEDSLYMPVNTLLGKEHIMDYWVADEDSDNYVISPKALEKVLREIGFI